MIFAVLFLRLNYAYTDRPPFQGLLLGPFRMPRSRPIEHAVARFDELEIPTVEIDGFEPDFADLEPEERRERSARVAREKGRQERAAWPEDATLGEAVAAERLASARERSTLFRARRLVRKGHGLEEPDRFFSTGVAAVDELLAGGLQRGELVEVTGWRCSGRFSLVLATLAAATQTGEAAALVDLGDHLDPNLALGAGIDLERLLWLRPRHMKDALQSVELLLGAGFPLVVFDAGQPPVRGGRGIEAAWLRAQRGAIEHQCALLVTSPYRLSGTAAHAVLELQGARGGWFGTGSAPRLLGGLVCEAQLAKSRLHRTADVGGAAATEEAREREAKADASDPHGAQRALQDVTEHVARRFELTYAGGLAESVAALPKLTPRRRRTRSIAVGSSAATGQNGKLRRVV